MHPFDQQLLDDEAALLDGDRGGLLRALATAGAQVRRAVETAEDFGVYRLAGEARPRAVLVAPDPNVPYLSGLLGALAQGEAPVLDWRDGVLPRWAGPADVLLVASADGQHPRLAELVAQADRRGLVISVAAPAGSPVAAAAARHPLADLSHLTGVPSRALWWSLATPALLTLDALGLATVRGVLPELADRLDEVAEAERPGSDAFVASAKVLAAELAESLPVFAGIGPAGTAAAHRVTGAVQLLGGSTAMSASLPDDVARIGSLLEFAGRGSEEDFFADREAEAAVQPRLVLIGDDDDFGDEAGDRVSTRAGRRAADALAGLARSRSIGVSRLPVPHAPVLVRFGCATATGDFAAAYLALARRVDPGAPRLGEPDR
ncbi:MAG TPA: SIS domain-containing protein [Jatrophihabitans sp.]|nr:SIS domain-containing protein [Jatrophihabitans sp.]